MEVELIEEECIVCHVIFWITKKHHKRLVSTKQVFYCPNGHSQHYLGRTDKEKYEEMSDIAENYRRDTIDLTNEKSLLEKELKELKKKKKPKKKKKR